MASSRLPIRPSYLTASLGLALGQIFIAVSGIAVVTSTLKSEIHVLVGLGGAVVGVMAQATLARARRRGSPGPVLSSMLLALLAALWGVPEIVDAIYDPHVTGVLRWLLPSFFVVIAAHNAILLPRDETGLRVPTLFVALFHLAAVLIPTIGILSRVFEIPLTGVLATSGLLTAILGLALQANLSNIFSGLFLNIEQPFAPGEWVEVDGVLGRVEDISWRSTRFFTVDNTTLIMPNDRVAKANIVNFNRHNIDGADGFMIFESIFVHPHHDPELVLDLIRDSLAQVQPGDGRGELGGQWAGCLGCKSEGLHFRFGYSCTDRGSKTSLQSRVYSTLHRVLTNAGVSLTSGQILTVLPEEMGLNAIDVVRRTHDDYQKISSPTSNLYSESLKHEVPLRQIPLFQELSSEQRQAIASKVQRHVYSVGERVVAQGAPGDSMFVITEGVARVLIENKGGGQQEVTRLGVGDFFGEMSLLTGEARTATVTCARPLVVLEVKKDVIAPLLAESPDLADRLGQVLAERKAALQKVSESQVGGGADTESLAESLKGAILRFFG